MFPHRVLSEYRFYRIKDQLPCVSIPQAAQRASGEASGSLVFIEHSLSARPGPGLFTYITTFSPLHDPKNRCCTHLRDEETKGREVNHTLAEQ